MAGNGSDIARDGKNTQGGCQTASKECLLCSADDTSTTHHRTLHGSRDAVCSLVIRRRPGRPPLLIRFRRRRLARSPSSTRQVSSAAGVLRPCTRGDVECHTRKRCAGPMTGSLSCSPLPSVLAEDVSLGGRSSIRKMYSEVGSWLRTRGDVAMSSVFLQKRQIKPFPPLPCRSFPALRDQRSSCRVSSVVGDYL